MQRLKPSRVIQYVFEAANDDITVRRAVNVLAYVLKSSEDTVIFANNKIQLFELGSHPDLGNLPADQIKIAFCGGPPGDYTTYKGTLLSLLVDRIAWEIVHGNVTIFEKLREIVGRNVVITSDDFYGVTDGTEQITHASEIPCPSI